MHTLALILSLFVQEPKSETITIPGTDLKFEMVYVPGGRAKIGSPENEPGRKPDEAPVHEVELRPFWISKNEVTWEAFVKYLDRKSTRLNSSHRCISYAVFCLKKKIK